MMIRLKDDFFNRDVLYVAPELIGKILVCNTINGNRIKLRITETEAYRGIEDKACHASKGKTPRNEVMYGEAGKIYIYLIYGMYWMLNFVTGAINEPQAVLIRGIEGYNGPGKLTQFLNLDKSFYGEDLSSSKRLWIEDDGYKAIYRTEKRIGIDYAGEYWKNMEWRFVLITAI